MEGRELISIFLSEPKLDGPPEKNKILDILDSALTVYAPGLKAFPKTKTCMDLTFDKCEEILK